MIRMNNFAAEPAALRSAEAKAVARVLASGSFILGAEGEQFEKAWAEFCGEKFCIGTANGLEAIELGLRALDIGQGDEVITTPVTAIATILAILHAGATPVFADVDPTTGLLNPESAERCLSPRTKAVLLVHLYGQIAEPERWKHLCGANQIHLLEDCAQAHGARWEHKAAGTFGSLGAFSFYPTKNLGAKGDAGAVITASPDLATRLRMLGNCGTVGRYEHREPGLNSRLDEVQAAILAVRLRWLDELNVRRRAIAGTYFSRIANPRVELMALPSSPENHVYHLFVIRCAERDRLSKFLADEGIESLIHYPIPAHHQNFCATSQRDPLGLLNSESHCDRCLSLPCHPHLSDDDAASVAAAINRFH